MRFCLISNLPTIRQWQTPANEIREWARIFNGDTFNGSEVGDGSGLRDYDVIMIECTANLVGLASIIKSRVPQAKIVILVEGFLNSPDCWPPALQMQYVQALNAVDLVGILVESALPYYRSQTSQRVAFIGIPYPLEWARANCQGPREEVIELGCSLAGIKNGLTTLATFKKLGRRGACYPYFEEEKNLMRQFLGSDNLEFRPQLGWPDYFREHSRYAIGLHMDYRTSWGRFPLDCASAGIPCVSSPMGHVQPILYPDTTVQPYDVEGAVAAIQRLTNDRSFYDHVVRIANERISNFDGPAARQRLLNAL